jgi:NAD(P)-dependent dehydrogenase (short-subunit alcohol dehydrogenase family)
MTNLLLNHKTTLITGAGRGFGAGIALGMARAGAGVAITDVNEAELAQTAAEIGAEGYDVLPILADVGDFAAMQHAVAQTVDHWGRLDVLVSNAAIMPLIPFAETTPDLWDKILRINLTGVYNGVKAAWDQMVAQGGGHCMAIASGASVRGFVDEVAYCAAKHALEGFTKALAMEAEPINIAVNTMGPGKRIKPTNITRAEYEALPAEERAAWVDPVDLAPAFVWLAAQPPNRFTGLRFDAGPLADTIAAEGYDFEFVPEKVTLYVADFVERLNRRTGVIRNP